MCSARYVAASIKRRADTEQAAALDRRFAQMRSGLGDRVLPIDELIAEIWARLNVPDPLPLIDGLLATGFQVGNDRGGGAIVAYAPPEASPKQRDVNHQS